MQKGRPRPELRIRQDTFLTPFLCPNHNRLNRGCETKKYSDMDAIVKSQFLSLYCMVLADGVIDARELEQLYKIGIEQYGLSQDEITATVRNAGSSFVLPVSLPDKIRFLYNIAQIAYADGVIDNSERELMGKYIIKMGFAEENADSIMTFLFDSVKNGISVDEIIKSLA